MAGPVGPAVPVTPCGPIGPTNATSELGPQYDVAVPVFSITISL